MSPGSSEYPPSLEISRDKMSLSGPDRQTVDDIVHIGTLFDDSPATENYQRRPKPNAICDYASQSKQFAAEGGIAEQAATNMALDNQQKLPAETMIDDSYRRHAERQRH